MNDRAVVRSGRPKDPRLINHERTTVHATVAHLHGIAGGITKRSATARMRPNTYGCGSSVRLDEFESQPPWLKWSRSVKETPLRHGQDSAPAVEHDRGFFLWSPGAKVARSESTVLASRSQ